MWYSRKLYFSTGKKGVKQLTCISNNAGVDDFGIGLMLQKSKVRKMVSSYVGENAEFERQLLSGELEVELIPQEHWPQDAWLPVMACPPVYTPAGVGTEVAAGKEIRNFNGKDYLMEYAFDADFALVKAWKGDTDGNLIYKETARNFNPMMAMAGKDDNSRGRGTGSGWRAGSRISFHTPGIYVHRIFQGKDYQKRIEQRTARKKVKIVR